MKRRRARRRPPTLAARLPLALAAAGVSGLGGIALALGAAAGAGGMLLRAGALLAAVLLGVLLALVYRSVAGRLLGPLAGITRHLAAMRASGTMEPLPPIAGDEELARLAAEFNALLRQLGGLREQLEVQGFTLGRSETAIAMVHNIRNALNPISTLLTGKPEADVPADRHLVERALAELAADALPAARRQKLVAFVLAAMVADDEARALRRQRVAAGRDALRQVLEIIGHQQHAGGERPATEPCDVTAIVARNATIARNAGDVSIAFSFPSRPWRVRANRVILSQVVANLFTNAVEAIGATARGSGSIAVAVRERAGRIELVIRDDGEGFDPAGATRLFRRGYSTRTHKSGGLGLHWCANAMLTMDGTLDLMSDGPGTGARVILTLPMAEAQAAAAA